MRRRAFVLSLAAAPLWLPACAHREETPLAHLYGKDWVHGAYELYAGKYAAVQTASEKATHGAYSVIAQKGVVALAALQTREVPFFIRVDGGEQGFTVARDVPERLTFTAGMSDADRQTAQAKWEKAREFIQTDYEEIRRLDWALTTLLGQMQHVRSAIDQGKLEQYRQVRQIGALAEGDKPPFDLPFQVGVPDYRDVLYLLLERLDDDAQRLSRVGSDIVTVGLTARATDANSGSLAANLNKVLLAVVTDADASEPRAATFPHQDGDRQKYLARGKELYDSIRQTPEYVTWEKHERTKAFDQIGGLLSLVDSVTGLHVSAIYEQVLDIWRGDADYFSYLKMLVKMLPGGSAVAKVADQAIELTEKARKVAGQVQQGIAIAGRAIDTGKRLAGGQLPQIPQLPGSLPGAGGVLQLAKDGGLLNAGSEFAKSKLGKQLAFFKDSQELEQVKGLMGDSSLMKGALPSL
ncbi:MAG: hypothetical protein ACRELB_07000 [Polyangiaceae bacterium]